MYVTIMTSNIIVIQLAIDHPNQCCPTCTTGTTGCQHDKFLLHILAKWTITQNTYADGETF